jgi:hypothetical protein
VTHDGDAIQQFADAAGQLADAFAEAAAVGMSTDTTAIENLARALPLLGVAREDLTGVDQEVIRRTAARVREFAQLTLDLVSAYAQQTASERDALLEAELHELLQPPAS